MFKLLHSKRGVSPIIAAVLLVVITIAIGATTMAFIKSLAESNIESSRVQIAKVTCGTDVNLEISIVQDKYKICYNDNGSINMVLHNIGSKNIEGFDMTIFLNDTIVTDSITSTIDVDKYEQMLFDTTANITNATNEVLQWRIEPKITANPGKGLTTCSDSAIKRDIDEISVCT